MTTPSRKQLARIAAIAAAIRDRRPAAARAVARTWATAHIAEVDTWPRHLLADPGITGTSDDDSTQGHPGPDVSPCLTPDPARTRPGRRPAGTLRSTQRY